MKYNNTSISNIMLHSNYKIHFDLFNANNM